MKEMVCVLGGWLTEGTLSIPIIQSTDNQEDVRNKTFSLKTLQVEPRKFYEKKKNKAWPGFVLFLFFVSNMCTTVQLCTHNTQVLLNYLCRLFDCVHMKTYLYMYHKRIISHVSICKKLCRRHAHIPKHWSTHTHTHTNI